MTGLRKMRSSSTRPRSIAAEARPAPPISTSLSVLASAAATSSTSGACGEAGVALHAIERAAEDDLRERVPDVREGVRVLVVAQRRIRLPHEHRLVEPAAQQAAAEPADLLEMEAKLLVARDAPSERTVTVGDETVHRDAHRVDQHGLSVPHRAARVAEDRGFPTARLGAVSRMSERWRRLRSVHVPCCCTHRGGRAGCARDCSRRLVEARDLPGGSRADTGAQLAINARGDALVLWTSRRADAPADDAGARERHAYDPHAAGAARRGRSVVVLDGRGAATAAWTSRGRLYAAGASSAGRWSRPQLIARRDAVVPTLAVARDRRVLLVWTVDTPTGARGRTGSRLAQSGPPLLARAAAAPPGAGPDAGRVAPERQRRGLRRARARLRVDDVRRRGRDHPAARAQVPARARDLGHGGSELRRRPLGPGYRELGPDQVHERPGGRDAARRPARQRAARRRVRPAGGCHRSRRAAADDLRLDRVRPGRDGQPRLAVGWSGPPRGHARP